MKTFESVKHGEQESDETHIEMKVCSCSFKSAFKACKCRHELSAPKETGTISKDWHGPILNSGTTQANMLFAFRDYHDASNIIMFNNNEILMSHLPMQIYRMK